MGDPCGIGPEIAAKALADAAVYQRCQPIVIGDADIIERAIRFVSVPLAVNRISAVESAIGRPGTIDVYDLRIATTEQAKPGKVCAVGGHAAYEAIKRSIELAMSGQIHAVVTAPVSKQALHLAGHDFAGHTEIFAHFTGSGEVAMMLAVGNLRIVHVSTHVSLRRACDLVSRGRVLAVIRLANQACRQLGIEHPRIGVAGLNPHAGESGLFGDEELRQIQPAIQAARDEGIEASGPYPPDTLFPRAVGGAFDVAVAMYHDQGHVPAKLAGFHCDSSGAWTEVRGVNVTLGLPIIRTSVDHGTAFDQAGTGRASEKSLLDAIDYAIRLAQAAGPSS
jgi:4-hydroxythreonine-4-phosphate dehydrogenase